VLLALGLGTPLNRVFVVGVVAFTAGLPKSAFTFDVGIYVL
jgi:hypothetical protein